MADRIILAAFTIKGINFEIREDFIGAEAVLLDYQDQDSGDWLAIADWTTEERRMSAKDWYEKVILYFQGKITKHFESIGDSDEEPDGDWFDKVRWHFKSRTIVADDNIAFKD